MKYILFFVSVLILLAGCSNESKVTSFNNGKTHFDIKKLPDGLYLEPPTSKPKIDEKTAIENAKKTYIQGGNVSQVIIEYHLVSFKGKEVNISKQPAYIVSMKSPHPNDGDDYADNEICAIVDATTGDVYKQAFTYTDQVVPNKKLDIRENVKVVTE
ncbi:hypothetical protein [Paenibacillus sp. V4I3]|uniref:hypothetical protein n=1 Tax=Paenibacillus sp. V4I3 TaxID=3042305 RepID=UPI0027D82828|nr:hypothetical protein [Paenibacillus sp. V4I3]